MDKSICDICTINKKAGVELQTVLKVMRLNENKRHKERGKFVGVKKRDAVINFILDIVEQFCLQISTAFVAIDYYDRITHEFSTDIKVQGKVGIVCLLVAAKYEERESNVPSFSFFCESSNSLFSSIDEISVYERDVLQALRWNMESITVAHYIDIFSETTILFKEDRFEQQPIVDVTVKYVKDFMHFFLSLSITQPQFSTYKPSVQAAAIILAARKASHITPQWRKELDSLTGVSFEDCYSCFEVLWKVFVEKYPTTSKEQIKDSPANVNAVV